ncbi:MAG: hypothetical protein MZV70_42180 [Desulfobacterales bacterium]|nr:hypothetical protein [Desulfobacterales bacterium]
MVEDAEGKTHVKAILFVILVIFIAGFVLGYYIWGYRTQKHSDYKEMLQQTIYLHHHPGGKEPGAGEAMLSTLENEVASLEEAAGCSG